MQIKKILILLVAVAGTAWLTTWMDDGLGSGWAYNVVRNWEEFGFSNLHGQLVANAGGYEAETHPEVYGGHRPASLYAAYLCHHLIGADGPGFLVYYALLAALVAGSAWVLLGRTERAFWLAVVMVLTPGYVSWQTTLDPNLAAVSFGFPFCAAAIWLLTRPVFKWGQGVILFLLILVYSAVNWTTILVQGMLVMTLLLLPGVAWRRLLIYAGLAAGLAGLVLLTSLASKLGKTGGSGGGFSAMLGGYGWGNTGYGVGLSTQTACLRLVATNFIGLLPVLLVLGWQFWRRNGWRAGQGLLFLVPALVAMVEVLGLRNYFGHHPWMSVHFILLGLMLTTLLWKERAVTAVTAGRPRAGWWFGGLAAAFLYTLVVLAAHHAHDDQELNLISLVQKHTSRDTTIAINYSNDPGLAELAPRLPELFDRHVLVITNGFPKDLVTGPEPHIWLTAMPPPAGQSRAETGSANDGNPVFQKMLGWYASHIAKRRAGDKLEVGDKYYLRQPDN